MTIFIIGFIILIVLNSIGFFILSKKLKIGDEQESDSISLLNQNVQGMHERLDKVSIGLNERLDNAARVIGEVNKELGTMQEIGRGMQSLQDFLKSPKLRGNLGEQVLQQMLDQYFPFNLYQMQYKFKEGQTVDAIIKTENGIIPIDSKFPMENFQRMSAQEADDERLRYRKEFIKDVKKHISDIAKKYILPDEGTVDFAIMYIPSESVYYEIIRDDTDLNAIGMEKRILFVSPNSFYYFLRVVMMGMQEKRMADAAKEMINAIRGIQKDSERFEETLGVLNRHITNAKSAIERTTSEYDKLSGKIEKVDKIDTSQMITNEHDA